MAAVISADGSIPATDLAPSKLPDYVMRMIHGKVSDEEKKEQYTGSLQNWWKEYASRKNDEEEEHVADSLLYDERCHLPRTTPPPTAVYSVTYTSQLPPCSNEREVAGPTVTVVSTTVAEPVADDSSQVATVVVTSAVVAPS